MLSKIKNLMKYLFLCAVMSYFSLCLGAESIPASKEEKFSFQAYPATVAEMAYSTIAWGSGLAINYKLTSNTDVFTQYYRTCGYLFKTNDFCIAGLGVGLKSFFTESTYLKFSVAQQKVDLRNANQGFLNAELNSLEIALGSLVRSGRFSFGIEWFGITKPLSGRITLDRIEDPPSEKKYKDLEDSKYTILSDAQLSLLKFFVAFYF